MKRYIWLVYTKLFFSKIRVTITGQGLHGKISFSFPFTNFPEDIKLFIPRDYEDWYDYMTVYVPFEKKSDYCNFSTAYIKEKRDYYYNLINDDMSVSYDNLERWVFYDFLHFLFKNHTDQMRNRYNQILEFQSGEDYYFWNFLIRFRFDFWFLRFFHKNLPIFRISFRKIHKEERINRLVSKVKKINLRVFERNNPLWLVLKSETHLLFMKHCSVQDIISIFQEDSNWNNKLDEFLSRRGYYFEKRDTRFGNNIDLEKEINPKEICFLFKKRSK